MKLLVVRKSPEAKRADTYLQSSSQEGETERSLWVQGPSELQRETLSLKIKCQERSMTLQRGLASWNPATDVCPSQVLVQSL